MMVFSSIEFIIFFLIITLILLVMQKKDSGRRPKHIVLLVASYIFYAWWDWRFCLLMMLVTVIAYFSAQNKDKKLFRLVGVIAPLVILGIFKYFNFFIDSFCTLFNIENVSTLKIILPVGISFYVFQAISYTVDAIKGKQEPAGFINLALYISFFPQLVAGPIVKASDFLPQLEEDRKITISGIETGICIFVFGLFKKIVLADHLAVFVDEIFAAPAAFDGLTLVLAVISYSLQIYFDFSGYSDMAVGAAKFLGYDLPVNFNMPYVSKNITEFWKRWHISLSSWLQQYLYIPLGGNRKGKTRTYINLMVTMALGGLWHGASWTFVIWGILHGAGLCIHKFFLKKSTQSTNNIFRSIGSAFLTYIFVCTCWIFFRATDFTDAYMIIRGIITWQPGISHMFMWCFVSIFFVVAASLIAVCKRSHSSPTGFYPTLKLDTIRGLFVLFFVIGMTLGLAYVGDNPFIYFQF